MSGACPRYFMRIHQWHWLNHVKYSPILFLNKNLEALCASWEAPILCASLHRLRFSHSCIICWTACRIVGLVAGFKVHAPFLLRYWFLPLNGEQRVRVGHCRCWVIYSPRMEEYVPSRVPRRSVERDAYWMRRRFVRFFTISLAAFIKRSVLRRILLMAVGSLRSMEANAQFPERQTRSNNSAATSTRSRVINRKRDWWWHGMWWDDAPLTGWREPVLPASETLP